MRPSVVEELLRSSLDSVCQTGLKSFPLATEVDRGGGEGDSSSPLDLREASQRTLGYPTNFSGSAGRAEAEGSDAATELGGEVALPLDSDKSSAWSSSWPDAGEDGDWERALEGGLGLDTDAEPCKLKGERPGRAENGLRYPAAAIASDDAGGKPLPGNVLPSTADGTLPKAACSVCR